MKKKKEEKATTTVSGDISGIKYRNSQGWSVFTVKGITCTGLLPDMCEIGTEVTCTGVLEDSKYGRQIKCESIIPAAPDLSSDSGVIKLLTRLPGIGPKRAAVAVVQFGKEEAWRLACEDPEKIGVKPDQAEAAKAIAASLLDSYDAIVYLLGIGLTDYQAATIYKTYGANTIQTVSENPYDLIDIDGFGFLTVDKIALKAGVSVGNPARIAACILYVLDDSASNGGHIYHQGWNLAEVVIDTLTQTAMKAEVPMSGAPDISAVRQQVHFLAGEGKIELSKGRVFSRQLIDAERTIIGFMEGCNAQA